MRQDPAIDPTTVPSSRPPGESSDLGNPTLPRSDFPRNRTPVSEARRAWIWPAFAALLACLISITYPQPFIDELTSWSMATRDFGSMLETAAQHDVALLPYYVVLHTWVEVFGDSVFALRLPSALGMAGAAACITLSGQRLFGRRAGVVAGVLFALVPEVARYGTEARPYAMVMCAVAASALLLLRALERSAGVWRWVAYGASVTAIGLFQLVALTSLMAHVVLVVLRARSDREAATAFGRAVLVGLLGTAPLALGASSQAAANVGWIPHPSGWSLLTTLQELYGSAVLCGGILILGMLAWSRPVRRELARNEAQGLRERPNGSQTESAPLPAQPLPQEQSVSTALATSASAGASSQRTERLLEWSGPREYLLFATVLAVGPLLAVWVVSHGEVSYFFFRYLLFTLIGWVLLAGAGLTAVGSHKAAIAIMLGIATLALPDMWSKRQEFAHSWVGVDYRYVANTIAQQHQPGDALVYARNDVAYHRRYDLGTTFYLPRNLKLRDVFLAHSAAERGELADSQECADPAACLLAADAKRIWLVAAPADANGLTGLTGPQAEALFKRYKILQITQRPGATLALMGRKTVK